MRLSLIIASLLAVSAATALTLPPGAQQVVEASLQTATGLTFLVAFLAGIVAFTSPCGFVLLPTFFGFWFKEKRKAVSMTAAFSIGLLIAYLALGMLAFVVGDIFAPIRIYFITISGIMLVVFGILAFLNKGFTFIQFKLDHQPRDWVGMGVMGFFFGIGWTPCVSPVLSGMFLLATVSGSLVKSLLLMAFFTLGISLPLLLLSYLSDKYNWAEARWLRGKSIRIGKYETHTYNLIAGVMLVGVGLLMVLTGGTTRVQDWLIGIWSMDVYNGLNEWLTTTSWFSSTGAGIFGIAAGIILVVLVARHLRRK